MRKRRNKSPGRTTLTDHVFIVSAAYTSLLVIQYFLAYKCLYCFDHRVGEKRHQDCVQSKDSDYFANIHLFIFAFERNHDQSTKD